MTWWLWNKPDPRKTQAAEQALESAEQILEETKERGKEVTEVTAKIRQYREENGFSGLFREAMRRI